MAFVYPPTTIEVDKIVPIHVGHGTHYFEFYNNSPYNIMLRPDNGGLQRNFNPYDILVPWSAKILDFPLEDDVFSYYVDPTFPIAANPGNHFEMQFIADTRPRNPSGIAYSALGLTDAPAAQALSDTLQNQENPPFVDVVRIKNNLDPQTRFYMRNDGSIRWGDGSVAPDLMLEVLQRYYLINHATEQFKANISSQLPTPPDDPNNAFFSFNGSTNAWGDLTAESNSAGGTAFTLNLTAGARSVYIGNDNQFDNLFMDLSVNATSVSGNWQYWNGSNWVNLLPTNDQVTNSIDFRGSGSFRWTLPSNWAQRSLTGIGGTPPDTVVRYWIRYDVVNPAGTSPQILQMRPALPVAPPAVQQPLWEGFDGSGNRTSWLMPDGSLSIKGPAWTVIKNSELPAGYNNNNSLVKWRVFGDTVEFVGRIMVGTGVAAHDTMLFRLPTNARPTGDVRYFPVTTDANNVDVLINAGGELRTYLPGVTGPTYTFIALDNVRFPIVG